MNMMHQRSRLKSSLKVFSPCLPTKTFSKGKRGRSPNGNKGSPRLVTCQIGISKEWRTSKSCKNRILFSPYSNERNTNKKAEKTSTTRGTTTTADDNNEHDNKIQQGCHEPKGWSCPLAWKIKNMDSRWTELRFTTAAEQNRTIHKSRRSPDENSIQQSHILVTWNFKAVPLSKGICLYQSALIHVQQAKKFNPQAGKSSSATNASHTSRLPLKLAFLCLILMQAIRTCQASRVQNLPANSVPAFLVESKKYEKVLSLLFSSETLSYSFSWWE